jgi:protoporphyrinogen oxidase
MPLDKLRRKITFVIIGAGPTGLGTAYRLNELGVRDFLILEANSTTGGLARSFQDSNGFTWDIGGHVCFSHYQYYDTVLQRALGTNLIWHRRRAYISFSGRWIPYPFQLNLNYLESAERDKAIASLQEAQKFDNSRSARHLGEWAERVFGSYTAQKFFLPYNEKIWGHSAQSLSYQWIRDRVAQPDFQNSSDITQNKNWGPNRLFRVPQTGGNGELWIKVAAMLLPIHFAFTSRVACIDPYQQSVTISTGETILYDYLISTIPLDQLAAISQGIPDVLQKLASRLRHSGIHSIGVGIRGDCPPWIQEISWAYFPQPDIPFHRVTILSNYSPNNVPNNGRYWSMLAEVTNSELRPVNSSCIVDWVIDGLRRVTLLPSEGKIVSRWHHNEAYGYPTPTTDRDALAAPLLAYFDDHKIYSRGRFGTWRYEISNQDHCFMQGVELAERLIHGTAERIIHTA